METYRLAILDLYDGTANQGMRCISEILAGFSDRISSEVFDVRGKAEVPSLDFDIYISSGGPGSPHEGDGNWDSKYFDWIDQVWQWNKAGEGSKKHVFFICHSFQMACKHFGVCEINRRKSKSFGTFPVHMTSKGLSEPLFDGLPDPFYVADFREWQAVQPNAGRIAELGAEILALEKERPHVEFERAIMAMRFSPECFGTQFHPEADPGGMLKHFEDPERRKQIVDEHSELKYLQMIEHLNDGDKIGLTHDIILPLFLARAIRMLQEAEVDMLV